MSRLLADGSTLVTAGSPLAPTGVFADHFTRGGVDEITRLGNGWIDFASIFPASYDPAGILNGDIVTRALTRSGFADLPYVPDPDGDPGDAGNHPGAVLPGVGGAWRQTGFTDVRVQVTWSGNLDNPLHAEGAPFVAVNPNSTLLGFGAWPSIFAGSPALLIGSIGQPPEDLSIIGGAAFSHTDGTPRAIEIRTAGGCQTCTVWLDDVQVSTSANGTDPIPIPEALHGSTLHGFAFDQHVVAYEGGAPSLANMQAAPALSAITIQEA